MHLSVDGRESASTQKQALSAVLFLYRVVLQDPLPGIGEVVRAKTPHRLPVVLDGAEIEGTIAAADGTYRHARPAAW